MNKISVLIAATLFMLSTASATSLVPPEEFIDGLNSTQTDTIKESYNENIDEVPGFVKTLVGDQRINLNIENQTYKVDMDKAEIETMEKGEWKESSLDVWADGDDIEEVTEAEEPKDKLSEKLDKGDIRYEEHGFVNTMKFTVAELLL